MATLKRAKAVTVILAVAALAPTALAGDFTSISECTNEWCRAGRSPITQLARGSRSILALRPIFDDGGNSPYTEETMVRDIWGPNGAGTAITQASHNVTNFPIGYEGSVAIDVVLSGQEHGTSCAGSAWR